MSNRIYGTRTDINEQEVRDFYNKRAAARLVNEKSTVSSSKRRAES